VGPGSRIGTLLRLHHRSGLLLPGGTAGRVGGALPRDHAVPVEYAQVLFHLSPLRAHADEDIDELAAASGAAGHADVPQGSWGVIAPTDGVFYSAPAPGAPPFVRVGSRIARGQPIGLVEVMKTFNQILYGGQGLPEEADVIETRCSDREEIRAGQVLIVVR
jgi:acetyl-CoA carboxylase biotin carboxyl carrier protein